MSDGTEEITSDSPGSKAINSRNVRHLLILLALLILCLLSVQGAVSSVLRTFVSDHVIQVGQAYLTAASKTSEETFLVISELKMALALIQSSEGGISFIVDVKVQLGQAVSAITDIVNISWLVSLASILSIKILQLLLNLSTYFMVPSLSLLFGALGVSYGLSPLLPKTATIFKQIAKIALFLVLLGHLLVPLTIYFTASISQEIFSENKATAHKGFQSLGDALGRGSPSDTLHEQVKYTINAFSSAQKGVHQKVTHIAPIASMHVAYAILEFVLLPVALMFLLVRLSQKAISRVWN